MASGSDRATDPSEPRARLAARLRALQAGTGKSLKELEPELFVSDSSLSRYLSGSSVPPWAVVERLSRSAGEEPAALRSLWEHVKTGRNPGIEQAAAPARPRRRPLLFTGAFVVTALVFGAGGFFAGRALPPRVVTIKPTEDAACANWAWPAGAGQVVQPPVHPRARDHQPTIELVQGKDSQGAQSAWARISDAAFGDRVWLDWSKDDAVTWTQCGPFPVTTSTGTSRAHPIGPGWLFRACGDVPTPAPDARGEACTNW